MEEGEELLWSVQELSAVRESGLVGALVGCLPRAPRQNTRLGRPLLLRAEERQVIREELQLLQAGEHLQTRGEHLQTRKEHLQLHPRADQSQPSEGPTETPNSLTELSADAPPEELHPHTEELHPHTEELHPHTEELHPHTEELHPHTEELHPHTEELHPHTEELHPHTEELHPHTEETEETEGPGGPSDGQQGAALRSEEELTEAQELQWEEFLSQSLEEQHQRSLDDRKSALTSSLSDRVSEAELASRLASLEQSFLFPRSALTVQLSTCRHGLPLRPIRSQDLPLRPIRSQDLPLQPIRSQDLPLRPIRSQDLPLEPIRSQDLPLEPIRSQDLPLEPIRSQDLPLEPIRSQDLPSEPIRGEQQSPEPMGVRLQVFRDLRRRGFYLTSGGKFGVDFLVYPGDPLRFHAHFMALCLPVGGSMPVAELLSCVRLSSNVKKTLLLCSVCPAGGVLYSSLQWSHMS